MQMIDRRYGKPGGYFRQTRKALGHLRIAQSVPACDSAERSKAGLGTVGHAAAADFFSDATP